MENFPISTDQPPGEGRDAVSAQVARRLGRLMAERGVPVRQQAGLLTALCRISHSQARRKLQGASWSFGEVVAVVRHFGMSLDAVFADLLSGEVARSGTSPAGPGQPQLEAIFLLGGTRVPCLLRLGAQVTGAGEEGELLAVLDRAGWLAGTLEQLQARGARGQLFRADQVLLKPATAKPIRIAILDDDMGTAETLGDWFAEAGYEAVAYTSGEQLLASPLGAHDAFVVDYLLAGGDSSQAIIATIRQALPEVPIVLLTGKLRDGRVSEADLTTLLRTSGVTFFEKPVRPSVLAAAIESSLDRIASRRAA